MNNEEKSTRAIGDELDAEQEKEIDECFDEIEEVHPNFIQVNPDEQDFDTSMAQVKRSLRRIEIKTADDFNDLQKHDDVRQRYCS